MIDYTNIILHFDFDNSVIMTVLYNLTVFTMD